MITLTNNFHNTEINIRADVGDTLTHSQVSRSRRALCGIADCSCSGREGTRGPQTVELDPVWDYDHQHETFKIVAIHESNIL